MTSGGEGWGVMGRGKLVHCHRNRKLVHCHRNRTVTVIEMSERAVSIILAALETSLEDHRTLGFDLNNVLVVYAWAAFEGYIQAALEDVFERKPETLASDKTMTFQELVTVRDDVMGAMVVRELDAVGRRSFNDLNAYLGSRLKAPAPTKLCKRMSDMYFLRNLIAHTAGRVRSAQTALVPEGVALEEKRIRVSTEYLRDSIKCLHQAVEAIDRRLYELYLS